MSPRPHSSTSARQPAESGGPAENLLLSIVDGSLAAVIVAAPWCMGGRHPLGQLVLVALSVIAATAWGIRQLLVHRPPSWTRSPCEFIFLAAVGLVLLQLAPLPTSILRHLSPHTAGLMPLWQAAGGTSLSLGAWNQVTMNPDATMAALVMLLAYGMLLLVAVQRIRRVDDVETILRWLAISVALLAGFAIVQYLAGNGKFLWIYQHPFRDTSDAVKGPFANKNHFAHLLALGLGPLVWLVHRSAGHRQRRTQHFGDERGSRPNPVAQLLPAAALGIVMFAGLLTLSRGGAVAMFVAALVFVSALAYAGLLNKKLLLGLAGAFLLIAAALTVHGYQRVTTRLGDFFSGSIDSLDQYGYRRALWQADLHGCRDYFPSGTGIGSHRDVYPMYFDVPLDVELTHAENGPLQVALEAGLPGLGLLTIGVGLCGYWCFGTLRRPASQRVYLCTAAVAASLAASVVHSSVDFAWYIPSLMAITIVLVACALRLWQFGRIQSVDAPSRGIVLSRWTCAAATACVVLVGAWMIGNRACASMAAPSWDRYLTYALRKDASTGRAAVPDQPVCDDLRQVIRWTPGNATAHLRLAQAYLRRFDKEQTSAENAMPLSQIRDAAVQSRFTSRAALDGWLSRAIGPRRRYLDAALWHARRALQLCPLLGEGYVYLGDLCFLEGAPPEAKPACLAQALKVRPYSGEVLLAAGSDAALSGDLQQAVTFWRGALTKDRVAQIALSDLLVTNRIPLTFVIEQFQPPLPVVRRLLAGYDALGLPDDQLAPLLTYYARLAHAEAAQRDDAGSTSLWLELCDVYRRLDEPEKMFRCLMRAVEVNPNDYTVRYTLGRRLFEVGHYAEAEKQLRWCLRRRPDDKHLQEMVARAVRQRVARSGASPTIRQSTKQ